MVSFTTLTAIILGAALHLVPLASALPEPATEPATEPSGIIIASDDGVGGKPNITDDTLRAVLDPQPLALPGTGVIANGYSFDFVENTLIPNRVYFLEPFKCQTLPTSRLEWTFKRAKNVGLNVRIYAGTSFECNCDSSDWELLPDENTLYDTFVPYFCIMLS
ncbi:hypothetical protein OQA88_1125 [Cercophora sp. LCS_1]